MAFFDDIFNAVTGQQSSPQQTIIPTNELLGQAYGQLQANVPRIAAYNQALQPVLTDIQLQNQGQIFGPAANQLQKNTYQSILDQLNLGTALPEDLQQATIQNALQGSAASGFGVGAGGRGLVARDLGLTGLDLQNRRQSAALGAINQLPVSHYTAPVQGVMDVGAVAQDIRGVQAAQDELANLQEDIRQKNFASLLNTGGRILGGVAGGILGMGNPMAIQAGQGIGGSLFKGGGVAGVNNQQAQQQSSNPFSSLLSLFGGGGAGGAGGYGGNTVGDFPSGFGTQFGGYA